jgi:hypothetical protein
VRRAEEAIVPVAVKAKMPPLVPDVSAVPPFATGTGELTVAIEPSPRLVLAVAALARSERLLALFKGVNPRLATAAPGANDATTLPVVGDIVNDPSALVTEPTAVTHPNPVPDVHCSVLPAAEHEGIASALGEAGEDAPLPTTVLAASVAKLPRLSAPKVIAEAPPPDRSG